MTSPNLRFFVYGWNLTSGSLPSGIFSRRVDTNLVLFPPAGGGQHGRPPESLRGGCASARAPTRGDLRAGHHGARAAHPVLPLHALQAHPHHLLQGRGQRGPVPRCEYIWRKMAATCVAQRVKTGLSAGEKPRSERDAVFPSVPSISVHQDFTA